MVALYRLPVVRPTPSAPSRTTGAPWSRSSGSSPRPLWRSWSVRSCAMTRRCSWPSRRGCRCGAIAWANVWAPAMTAPCTRPASPASTGSWRSRHGQGLADRPGFVRCFETTVQLVASLRQPGIVDIQDYWREPGAALRGHAPAAVRNADRPPRSRADDHRGGGEPRGPGGGRPGRRRRIGDQPRRRVGPQRAHRRFRLGLASPTSPSCPRTRAAAADDVHDFALMVQQRLDAGDGDGVGNGVGVGSGVADVVAGGVATVDRPAMPDLVADLLEALSDRRPTSRRLPTPTRACGPSTRSTPTTTSAAGQSGRRDPLLARSPRPARPVRVGRWG